MSVNEAKKYIYEQIKNEGFIYPKPGTWFTPEGKDVVWVFDLKALFLEAKFLEAVVTVFWSIYDRTKPIQICGLESAAIPLVTALVLSGEKANGLYIRKSKKKKYDFRQLEGKLTDAPIVVVDDVVNFCTSLEKQIVVLQIQHHDVQGFFSCVHLRPLESYAYLRLHYGIKYNFLFGVHEFAAEYDYISNKPLTLEIAWHQKSIETRDFNVTRRMQLAAGMGMIFHNADDGYVYAYRDKFGDLLWRTQIQKFVPHTLNQPGLMVFDQELLVAAENGTVLVLEAISGAIKQHYFVTDHLYGDVISGPLVNKVFLTGKQGGKFVVVLFDYKQGKKVFEYKSDCRLYVTVASDHETLIISSQTGLVSAFYIKTGLLLWQFSADSTLHDSVTIDESSGSCFFISENGTLYQNKIADGKLLRSQAVSNEPFFFARPTITNSVIVLTALHRTVYALDKNSWQQLWEYNTSGRIFSRPTSHNGQIWFGNNESILYSLNTQDGLVTSKTVLGDRIVSEPIFFDNHIIISSLGGDVWNLSLKKPEVTPSPRNSAGKSLPIFREGSPLDKA